MFFDEDERPFMEIKSIGVEKRKGLMYLAEVLLLASVASHTCAVGNCMK